MPFINRGTGRTQRLLATISGLAVLAIAAPAAHAASSAANPLSCVPQPTLTSPFSALGDNGNYTLLPGGDFESSLSGWTVSGTSIVAGNESYNVGASTDHSSLSLPSGSFAVSAPFCLDQTYPTFRFFARNTGDPKAQLNVDVLYVDTQNKLHSYASGTYSASTSAWTLTPAMNIGMQIDSNAAAGAAPVAFRFTPVGKGGNWQIDDIYIDPMART